MTLGRDIGRIPFGTCCYACNRIIRRDFWGDRRFPTAYCVGEDAPIHYSLLFSAERIGAYKCPFYFYRQRANSLMSDHKNMVRIFDGHKNLIQDIYRDIQEYPFREELMPYYGVYVFRLLCNTYSRWRTDECLRKIRSFLRAPEQSWMCDGNLARLRFMVQCVRWLPESIFVTLFKAVYALHQKKKYGKEVLLKSCNIWPLRKFIGGVKCLRENGLCYTVRHIIGGRI